MTREQIAQKQEALAREIGTTLSLVRSRPTYADADEHQAMVRMLEKWHAAAWEIHAALPASSPAAPDHGPWKMTVTTWFRCPECGPCGVDEDSCCSTCGSDVEAATGRP